MEQFVMFILVALLIGILIKDGIRENPNSGIMIFGIVYGIGVILLSIFMK